MQDSHVTEQFVQQLAECQARLFGYVFSLLGDRSRAADVVQETNLVLWRKIDQYQPDRPFLPWAFGIARFQVLAHLRDQQRDRLLLDADLAETLSSEAERQAQDFDAIRESLQHCLQVLTEKNRTLIEQRYYREMSLTDIAATAGRTVGALKVALLRVRRQLAECVQQRIAVEG